MVSLQQAFYIDEWLVEPSLNRISRAERIVSLEPQAIHVLVFLADRAGEVVFRQELLDAFWPDLETNESALTRTIFDIRTALGDDARNARYIETIRKRGYRLVAPIQRLPRSPKNDKRRVPSRTPAQPTFAKGIRPYQRGLLGGALAALLTIGWVVLYDTMSSAEQSIPVTPLEQVTSLQGEERDPNLAPDGSALAFVWDDNPRDGDNFDVFIKQLGAGSATQRTDSDYDDRHPVWSPDGATLAFVRLTGKGCALYTIPVFTGAEQKVGACHSAHGDLPTLAWLPDGQTLIYADRSSKDEPYRLFRLDTVSGTSVPISTASEQPWGDYYPAPSPDGQYIAFSRQRSFVREATIYILNVSTGEEHTIGVTLPRIYGLTWAKQGLIAAGKLDTRLGLWRLDTEGRKAPVWLGHDQAVFPTTARQTEDMAYVVGRSDANVWGLAIPRAEEDAAAQPLITSTRWDVNADWSPAGDQLVFISSRTGHTEIWTSDLEHTQPIQRTHFKDAAISDPQWSPTGEHIVFAMRRGNLYALYQIASAGGPPELLYQQQAELTAPTWSRAGDAIYFGSALSGQMQIARLNLSARTLTRVTTQGGYRALESQDGHFLYIAKGGESQGIYRQPLAGGTEEVVIEALFWEDWRNWDVHGKRIYFLCREHVGGPMLRSYDTETEAFRDLYQPSHLVSGFSGLALSPDGTQLVFSQFDQIQADIMLAPHL